MNDTIRKSFFGKKVFVTGHTGFKGAWLSTWLLQMGATVKGFSLPPPEQSLYSSLNLSMESVYADILDFHKLKNEILAFKPDFVFHLAAQSLVLDSYKNPRNTFEVNVLGTIHVMEALRNLINPCAAVLVTTDKVYENNEQGIAFSEKDSLGGNDPYSASKAAAEIAIASYRASFFSYHSNTKISIASARAGNVIGGGDFAPNRIIPDLIRAVQNDTPLVVRNPESIRPWQHVLEPLNGYLQLASHLSNGKNEMEGAFNFGPEENDVLTVRQLAELGLKFFPGLKMIEKKDASAPKEANTLRLNIQKSKDLLHWSPHWSSRESLNKTLNWYREVLFKDISASEQTIKEILAFEKEIG